MHHHQSAISPQSAILQYLGRPSVRFTQRGDQYAIERNAAFLHRPSRASFHPRRRPKTRSTAALSFSCAVVSVPVSVPVPASPPDERERAHSSSPETRVQGTARAQRRGYRVQLEPRDEGTGYSPSPERRGRPERRGGGGGAAHIPSCQEGPQEPTTRAHEGLAG